ncbi:MAG: 7TM-DISM domain-containing protein [Pseudomonadota bacterium]
MHADLRGDLTAEQALALQQQAGFEAYDFARILFDLRGSTYWLRGRYRNAADTRGRWILDLNL